jgi:predicted permease
VLLKPLPYFQPNRLVVIQTPSDDFQGFSTPNLNDWRSQSKSLEAVGYVNGQAFRTLEGQEVHEGAVLVESSPNLMEVLGVKPLLGRSFLSEEEQPGKASVMILGAQVWRKAFHSDPQVLGRKVTVWSKPYTIVGVMPESFSYPMNVDMEVWVPYVIDPKVTNDRSATLLSSGILGRLKPGVTPVYAQSELNGIQARNIKAYANLHLKDHVEVTELHDSIVKRVRLGLVALYGAVLLVWMISCVNVANLMLTRSLIRRHEISIRGALGASRWSLVRYSLMESLVLSGLGSILGLSLAVLALKVLWLTLDRLNLPLLSRAHIDLTVALSLVASSLLTALLIGLVPAILAARAPVQGGLRVSLARSGHGRGQARLRDVLVIAELAMTLVLLVSAGLFMRTLYALHHVPLGFRTENIVSGAVLFPQGLYEKNDVNRAVFEPLLARIERIPGVRSAAITSVVPMNSNFTAIVMLDMDGKESLPEQEPKGALRIASAAMADTLGIRMLQGRFFSKDDTADSPAVAVVNQAFVGKYLSGTDPLLHTLNMGKKGKFKSVAIIGVIDDVKQTDLRRATEPEIYFCNTQVSPGSSLYGVATAFIQLAVRTEAEPRQTVVQIQKLMHEVAPESEVMDIKTMQDLIEESIGSQTLAARLLEIFAAVALLIAVVGLYGLLAYGVNQRTREIGVRMALGAQRGNVLSLVLRHAAWLLGLGLVLGVVLSLVAGKVLRTFVFGVSTHDGWTVSTVALIFLGCGLVAAYLPARRAAEVNPVEALRAE